MRLSPRGILWQKRGNRHVVFRCLGLAMFSIILLCLNIALFLYILVYGICFLMLPFVRRSSGAERSHDKVLEQHDTGPVTVLIPAHQEGPSVVRAVDSILEQTYPGFIESIVLVEDFTDSGLEYLQKRFGFKKKSGEITVFRSDSRSVVLLPVGKKQKKDKLNFILPRMTSDFIAFLDADHAAEPDWISSSLCVLTGSTACGVQSRRAPLSLKKFPQLWDSAQNHIGNELVNSALQSAVGSVFFTGTTAVFRREALAGRTFGDCVTEDTYLSYELLRDGEHIEYNAGSGSHEEVSPDIHSYLARRRRWSCGHNKTFFTLFPQILKSNASTRVKIATLIHGLFYTVPVAVCLLLNLYSLHLFVQYTQQIQILVLLITLLISAVTTLWMFGKHRNVIRELLVLMSWVLPQVTLLFPVALYYTEHELFFFLTLFPYMRYLFYSHVFCLFAPVVLLVIGSMRIRLFRPHQMALLCLSYPIFFFLDLWACLLGFSDFLFGRPTWAKIQRTFASDFLAEGASSKKWVLTRWAGAIAVSAFLLVSFNDLTADSNCGRPDGLLFEPRLFVPASELDWSMKRNISMRDAETFQINFSSAFTRKPSGGAELAHFIDGQLARLDKDVSNTETVFPFEAPAGWESHKYEAVLRNNGSLCRRTELFTTTVKEFRGKKLFVNGEPFLVKGVIPSFSPGQQRDLSPRAGLAQIKQLGANTTRFYHAVREEMKDAAAAEQLLVVDQPDRSTWDEVGVRFEWDRKELRKRFEKLILENRNYPFSLFHTVGNELEIKDPGRDVPYLSELINEVLEKSPGEIFSYSTFYVFLRLPAAIYGINMLDSSETYWKKGLDAAKANDKPFFASEFGGFVAFLEWTPPELRVFRLFEYWDKLLAAGAFGAIIHQSHDNYGQPVIQGMNDPLTADQPDDTRGIWDNDNKPKPLAKFVERLFSDFDAETEESSIGGDARTVKVRFKNRREYSLSNVKFSLGERKVVGPIDFLPSAEHIVEIPLEARVPEILLTAGYTTHRGLENVSQIALRLPLAGEKPSVLNSDLLSLEVSEEKAEGRLLFGKELSTVLPAKWKEVRVNGTIYPVQAGRQKFALRPAMEDTVSFETSKDGKTYTPASVSDVGKSSQRIRFKLARQYPPGAHLLIAGIGSGKYWLQDSKGNWKETKGHKYRENLIPLDSLSLKEGDYITLLLQRNDTVFISEKDNPLKETVGIDFEMPKVFSPVPFLLERVS